MHVGVALLLGGMLVAAGLPKIIAPWYVASALRRVIDIGSDRTLRVAGRALGGWELALGAAVLLVAGPAAAPVAALTLITFTGFAGFVVLAIRRGAACGCWASLTEGPAGGAELGRAVFLAALSADLLAARLAGSAPGGPGWQSIAPAAGLLAGTYLAARLGAALLPVPNAKLRRQLGSQVAPGAAGRAGAQLALLGGFVHAGTAAGR